MQLLWEARSAHCSWHYYGKPILTVPQIEILLVPLTSLLFKHSAFILYINRKQKFETKIYGPLNHAVLWCQMTSRDSKRSKGGLG